MKHSSWHSCLLIFLLSLWRKKKKKKLTRCLTIPSSAFCLLQYLSHCLSHQDLSLCLQTLSVHLADPALPTRPFKPALSPDSQSVLHLANTFHPFPCAAASHGRYSTVTITSVQDFLIATLIISLQISSFLTFQML